MERSLMVLADKSNKTGIVSVDQLLESEVPELPLETSFKVNWFVVEGNQIQYLKERTDFLAFDLYFLVEDDDNSPDDSPDVQLLNQSVRSVHSLSFECELYLKKIKSRLYSPEEENTEVFHQLQTDEGLNQLCPYLVNWIQSTVLSPSSLLNRPKRSCRRSRFAWSPTSGTSSSSSTVSCSTAISTSSATFPLFPLFHPAPHSRALHSHLRARKNTQFLPRGRSLGDPVTCRHRPRRADSPVRKSWKLGN